MIVFDRSLHCSKNELSYLLSGMIERCCYIGPIKIMLVGEPHWNGDDAMVTCYCTGLLHDEGLRELGNDKRCQEFSKEVNSAKKLESNSSIMNGHFGFRA